MEIKIKVPGVPVGKQRPRVTMHGTYTPQKTADYESLVRWCWRAQSGECFCSNVALKATMRFYMPIPQSLSDRKRKAFEGQAHVKRGDLDNFVKAVCDALNKIAYADDAQISCIDAVKLYSAEPRAEIEITDRW